MRSKVIEDAISWAWLELRKTLKSAGHSVRVQVPEGDPITYEEQILVDTQTGRLDNPPDFLAQFVLAVSPKRNCRA